MAGNLWTAPRMIEAFYHELLGVILIYCVEGGVNERVDYCSEPRYLRTESDGDPAYLATVTAHLREHWNSERSDFSLN